MGDLPRFGRWVRQRRKMLGLSQPDLAERLNCAFETVRKIESGSRRPSRDLAALLGRALAVQEPELPAFIAFARADDTDPPSLAGDAAYPISTPPRRLVPSNLPAQRTSFVGRKEELARLQDLILQPAVRLLTLIGPPGIGKTRLAFALAEAVHSEFIDGVQFVPLSAVDDPTRLVPAVARALGRKLAPGQPAITELKNYLADKELLLLLDNFEQITAAAGVVSELVDGATALKIVVTSRSSLGIYGEYRYPVPPLALPASEPTAAETLRGYEAVQLFAERAQAVRPGFVIGNQDVAIVAEIVRQLDGLPLAIELAAARVRVLRPGEIRARLGDKLRLLADGPVDLPARQQTLRGAIGWSYDLLSREERKLFQRMAVFVGGGTREAIDSIAALPAAALDTLLSSLLDKSLLRLEERPGRPPRFWMLWTIREFAAECLAASGDDALVRERHAAHYLTVAEVTAPHLTGPERRTHLEELDEEFDNLRVALGWYLVTAEQAAGGIRLAGFLDWYWYFRGYLVEGRSWLEKALRAAAVATVPLPVADRGRALSAAGWLAVLLNDCQVARSHLDAASAAWREAGQPLGLALALARSGTGMVYCNEDEAGRPLLEEAVVRLRALLPDPVAHWHLAFVLDMLADVESLLGQFEQSHTYHMESLIAYQAQDDEWGIGQQLSELGRAALHRRDYASAQRHLEGAIRRDRQVGHPWNIAATLRSLGDVALCQSDAARAGACYSESLALYQELGDRGHQAALLRSLGHVARAGDQHDLARHYYRRALLLGQEAGIGLAVSLCLAGLAGLAVDEGLPQRAAILFGAATGQASGVRRSMPPADEVEQERYLARVGALLGEDRLASGLTAGQALPREVAIAFAISSLPDPAPWIAGSPVPGDVDHQSVATGVL
jgi:predicted ATPase/DNA-binding XRE family transcriptional regulator